MIALAQRRPVRQVPALGVRLRVEHPLARGLRSAVPALQGAGSIRDLVRDRTNQTSSMPTWIGGGAGRAAYGWQFTAASSSELPQASPLTLAAFIHQTSPIANGSPVAFGLGTYGAGGFRLLVRRIAAPFGWAFQIDSTVLNLTTPDLGGDHLLVGTLDAALAATLYVDGLVMASGTATGQPTTGSALQNSSSFTPPDVLGLYVGYLWNRVLVPEEVRQLAADPWQLLEESVRRYYSFNAAVPSQLELDADMAVSSTGLTETTVDLPVASGQTMTEGWDLPVDGQGIQAALIVSLPIESIGTTALGVDLPLENIGQALLGVALPLGSTGQDPNTLILEWTIKPPTSEVTLQLHWVILPSVAVESVVQLSWRITTTRDLLTLHWRVLSDKLYTAQFQPTKIPISRVTLGSTATGRSRRL